MRARAAALLALVLVACGGESTPEPAGAPAKPPSDRLVDLKKKPPLVNTLDIDPATKDFLLTTNRGFFRMFSCGFSVPRLLLKRARSTVSITSISRTEFAWRARRSPPRFFLPGIRV